MMFLPVCSGSSLYSFDIDHGAGAGKRYLLLLGARGTSVARITRGYLENVIPLIKDTVPKFVLESGICSEVEEW